MARSPKPWFRFYVEAVHDQKIRGLTYQHRWLWVCLLAAARSSPISGALMVAEEVPMTRRHLADYSGMTTTQVEAGLQIFQRMGMIERDEQLDAWRVTNWKERQYESDNVTERTRKHRSLERSKDVPGNVPKSILGTPPETETETDTESSKQSGYSQPPVDNSAAALIDQALDILVDRRMAGRVLANPAGYRHSVKASLRKEHAAEISRPGECWTSAQELANWLEPPVAARAVAHPDFAPGTGRLQNWTQSRSGSDPRMAPDPPTGLQEGLEMVSGTQGAGEA